MASPVDPKQTLQPDPPILREPERVPIRLEIPPSTFFRVFLALLIAAALFKLAGLLMLLVLSVLLAVTLQPLVEWLQARRLPRWAAIASVAVAMVAGVGVVVLVLIPEVIGQLGRISKNLVDLQAHVEQSLPPGWARNFVHRIFVNPEAVFGKLPALLATVGSYALGGLSSIGLLLILALYLLIDGAKAYQWLLAYFRPQIQARIRRTAAEVTPVVFAYVAGQAITSAIVAVYSFVTHTLLGVPGALTLAMIAAIFDLLPVVGFITSTSCAVIMALTVSPGTALAVVGLHVAYQTVENYIIVPRVYGNRLRLSTLSVLVSFLVAGILAGIPGAILVLPIVASYPIVEKLWLRRYVGQETVERHQEQLDDQESERDRKSA